MTYEQAKRQRDELETAYDVAGRVMNSFPKASNGLTTNEVKDGTEYQAAKAKFQQSFKELRAFNSQFTRLFRKEIKAERRG